MANIVQAGMRITKMKRKIWNPSDKTSYSRHDSLSGCLCQNTGKKPIKIPEIHTIAISSATFLLVVDEFRGKFIDCINRNLRESMRDVKKN